MNKVKSYKAKGANIKPGKTVDHSRLEDNEKFWRTKDEIQPELKNFHKNKKTSEPKNINEFVKSMESKQDEKLGLY